MAERTYRVVVPGDRPMDGSRLTIVRELDQRQTKGGRWRRMVEVRCDCGTVKTIPLDGVYRSTVSCGCARMERARVLRRSHGASATPLYQRWRGMRTRCGPGWQRRNPNYSGVKCDPRWDTFEGFVANPPCAPGGHEFDETMELARTGDVGDYSPENCRWATRPENIAEMNARRTRRLADGRPAAKVAEENGITRAAYQWRLHAGIPLEVAATIPDLRVKDSRIEGRHVRGDRSGLQIDLVPAPTP